MRASIIAIAALAAAYTTAAKAQSSEEIILADPAFSLTFSAGYIASDLDLWGKHGIKVKTVQITGIGAINSVISGSSHFAQASASSFGRATARGQKLIAIATTIDRPFAQVVLRKEIAERAGFDPKAPLEKRAAVLKGRTIAVDSINSMIHAYVRLIAARGGFNPDDIRVAPMAPNSMLAAFQSKQIDGYAMSLPWPLKAVQDGEALLIASGPDGEPGDMIPFGHNLIVTKQDTCAQKKALCRAMGQSIKDATAFIKTRPDEAFALLKKRFPTLDDNLLKASFEELRKVTPSPPVVNKASIENSETFNVDAGLLKADEKLKSYDGIFTSEYVN
ncbi:MAG: ABC transporter substrate-binding protein [Xanthobacteraceae bacterium]|nr:ABC transporter substrate-binding protein [Xanthobacteraceae bacterium]